MPPARLTRLDSNEHDQTALKASSVASLASLPAFDRLALSHESERPFS
jgi:hypothetical protein